VISSNEEMLESERDAGTARARRSESDFVRREGEETQSHASIPTRVVSMTNDENQCQVSESREENESVLDLLGKGGDEPGRAAIAL
jgi:hypothetical protein